MTLPELIKIAAKEIFACFHVCYDFKVSKKAVKASFKVDFAFVTLGAGIEIDDMVTTFWIEYNGHKTKKNIMTGDVGRAVKTLMTYIKAKIFGDEDCQDKIDDVVLSDKEAKEMRKYKLRKLKKIEDKKIERKLAKVLKKHRKKYQDYELDECTGIYVVRMVE